MTDDSDNVVELHPSRLHGAPTMTAKQMAAFVARGCQDPECKNPGDHPLVLGPACHPGAPTVIFGHKDGTALVMCVVCQKPVVTLVLR